MWLTNADDLRGILPVVISGGRPLIRQRQTAKFLADLHGVTADPVWVILDKDAIEYQEDGHEVVPYTRAWAEDYAKDHWTGIKPLEPGGFFGAFPGREFACQLAEERGCWAILQMDDNIRSVSVFRHRAAGNRVARWHGGLGMFADVLASIMQSTNGVMVGAFLASVNPDTNIRLSRAGFPYSLFLEKIDGREHWYGPFEDDITHAYQYGSSATPGTSLVVPPLVYCKETASKSGMRAKYNSERSVPLQRMFPESAKIRVNKTHSNGRGGARVFHKMANNAIRTPQIITNRERYAAISSQITAMGKEFSEELRRDTTARARKRAARWGPEHVTSKDV